jgi:hypothetical protein
MLLLLPGQSSGAKLVPTLGTAGAAYQTYQKQVTQVRQKAKGAIEEVTKELKQL